MRAWSWVVVAFCAVGAQCATIKWFGHAYFLIEDSRGTKVAIDPFGKELGYHVPDVVADAVLMTHNHFDHNARENVKGREGKTPPAFLQRRGEFSIGSIKVKGIKAYHDEVKGRTGRGQVTMYLLEVDEVRILHCGDLGHTLTKNYIRAIGKVDVLLIPVGGFFTIPPEKVDRVVVALKPRVVIPMHYLTEAVKNKVVAKIAPVSKYIADKENVKHIEKNSIDVSLDRLPEKTEIWIPSYE